MSNRPTSSPPIGPPGGGDPTKKAMNFGPSLKRLLGRLSPDKPIVVLIFALVTASVVLSSIAPKILGNATNLIFDGIVSKQLQPGTTKEQAVEGLRASGQGQLADMVSGMAVVPGTGIDFDAVGKVLMIVLLLFVCASLFSWLQAYLSTSWCSGPFAGCVRMSSRRFTDFPCGTSIPMPAVMFSRA